MNIHKNITLYREMRGMSQKDLAEAIEIKQTRLSAYETGRSTPSLEVTVDIAKALGITVDMLIRDMKCECGYELDPKWNYCPMCGKSQTEEIKEEEPEIEPVDVHYNRLDILLKNSTYAEVAKQLDVTVQTVKNWDARKKVPPAHWAKLKEVLYGC